jgi:hypothetical protein
MVRINKYIDIDTYLDVDVDISVQDFYKELSNNDVSELIELLLDDQLILGGGVTKNDNHFLDVKWRDSVTKLFSNRWKLSDEDIETIEKIADKL